MHKVDDYLAQMKTPNPFVPGPAAAWAVPAGISLIGGIMGSGAQNKATEAAGQATAGQNALQQQQLKIYQQLYDDYQKNQQPLEAPLSSQYQGILGGINQPGITGTLLNSLQNPDAATGVPLQGLTQQALQYLSNPQATNASQVGQSVLPALTSGGEGNTTLGMVGPQALQYYLNQAQHGGIDPTLINSALGQQQTGFDKSLNDIRNASGGRANIGSLLGDATAANETSRAQLISQLTGQSQQLRNQAEGSLTSTAGGLDAQSLQYMLAALQAGGGLDAQTLAMLTGGQTLGTSAQQTQLGNLGTANTVGMNDLQTIQNAIAQGKGAATGTATGLGGIAATYGANANAIAGNAAQASQSANPFTGLSQILAANQIKFPTGAPTAVPAAASPTSGFGGVLSMGANNGPGYGGDII